MAAKDTNEDVKNDDQEAGHSLDMSQAAVKKLLHWDVAGTGQVWQPASLHYTDT